MTETILQSGLDRYRAGDLQAAEVWFRQSVQAQPDEPTGLFLLALLRAELGDPGEAEQLLNRVVAVRQDHAPSWSTLGALRQSRSDHQGATAAYAEATRLDPDLASAWLGLAQCKSALGDHAGALLAADAAIAAAPPDEGSHRARAAALSALGRRREAVEAYERATELAPGSAMAHLGLAAERLQLGEPAAALGPAERATELDGSQPLAWSVLGAALQRTGDWASAAPALERSLELDPRQHSVAFNLGLLHAQLNKPSVAARWLEHAIELDPSDSGAHVAISTVYCSVDRFELGRLHAERALAIDPTLLAPHQNLARILAREDRARAAKRHRDRAYGARSFFIAQAPRPVLRVLVLSAIDLGNTPDRYLLPADRYTRIYWYAAYGDERQTRALPDYDVVLNAIGDHDETRATARNVSRFLKTCEKPVLNRPRRIARTLRHLAPKLFAGVPDLVVPAVARLGGRAIAKAGLTGAAQAAGVETPFIVRPAGSHGGAGAHLVTGAPPDAGEFHGGRRTHYVTAFHDFRSADGLYRKYRMIYVGDEVFPYHLAIGPDWMLHYERAGMAQHPERLREEQRFLETPEAVLGPTATAALRAIGRRLALDFAGVDFSLLPDGRVLLFEANATMLVHLEDPTGPLAHKNPFVEAILQAFQRRLHAAAASGVAP
ncbi:MAG TPA: tetratricopeptide repeat protein [Caulobacteraceae bacterium]|nr:tetratricopeptide repeat protein [Caulobacteraceae bacterium]